MFKKLFTLRALTSQRGAMFSMDARIALIIASVLAGVVGTQVIQRIERNKVAAAEQGVAQLMEGLKNYYTTESLDDVPPGGVADAFNTPTDNFESVILDTGLVTQDNLNTDPWGEVWTYDECNRPATIEGSEVTVHHVVVFSHGPDGVPDSAGVEPPDTPPFTSPDYNFLTDGSCATNYANWSAQGDDIGEKFSTFDIERKRVEITRERLNSIREALGAYESSKFMEAQTNCPGASYCDFDGSTTYESGEEENYNFFPTDGGTTATYFEASPTYNNNIPDMEDLVILLGLNSNLAQDPWGRTLCYESNRTGRPKPPFSAKVEYTSGSCPTPQVVG